MTSTEQAPPGTTSGPAARRASWWLALLITAVLTWWAIEWQYGQTPLRGHENADPFTSVVAAALRLLAVFAGLGTAASLAGAVARQGRSAGRGTPLDEDGLDRMAAARHWSLGWMAAALGLTPFDAADTTGIAVTTAMADLVPFLLSTQTTQAWLLTAVVALLVSSLAPFVRGWKAACLMLAVVVLAQLPAVLTAQVSVGADHDLATDAALGLTLAVALLTALALGLGPTSRSDLLRRYQRVAGPVLLLALPARALVGWFEMAGEPWLAAGYGASVVVSLLLLAGLALTWVARTVLLRRGERTRAGRLLGLDGFLLLLLAGMSVVQSQLVPPRFRVPQTAQENYLGYDVAEGPTWLSVVTPGRVNLMLLVLAVVMVGLYLAGVATLRRRGDRWPRGRTAAWVVGWSLVAYLAVSQVWQYASTTFSWHMVVHMLLNMGAPALFVLSGPITLLLRARRGARPGGLLSLRDLVGGALAAKPLHVLAHPLLIWVLFVSSFYLLYLTGIFDSVMSYHWSHQLMNLHFLVVGTLYYQVVIGVDAPARPIPHVAKLGYILAAMPFHAFFAVAVLNSAVIGADYYSSLDLAWAPDPAADQQVGGQLAWGMGELPLLGVTIALLAQWFSSDQRAARRYDRASAAGHDQSLDAYNQMLAELAARENAGSSPTRRGATPDRGRDEPDGAEPGRSGVDGTGTGAEPVGTPPVRPRGRR